MRSWQKYGLNFSNCFLHTGILALFLKIKLSLMRKLPLLILALIVFSSFSVHNESSGLPSTLTSSVSISQNDPVPMERLAKMKIKEAEKILGRKLTLKEKIAFKF